MLLVLFVVLVTLFIVLPVIGLALWALISTIVVGLVIGSLGRLIVPGRQPIGFAATVMAGLIGSILGAFLGQHVWDLSRFATVLIELGIAAGIVALLARARRNQISRTRPSV